VRTRAVEQEEQDKDDRSERNITYVGGTNTAPFPSRGIDGQQSSQGGINLVIRRQFSGELVHAERRFTSGVARRRRVFCQSPQRVDVDVTLKPGEEKT